MTKGGNSKPKMLGRLIFGEKRKQHASPSRHRSVTRNGGSMADIPSSTPAVGGGGTNSNRNLINLHDWAVWRMHLNEQMGTNMMERNDLKHMRQFLHANPFYQQHSRDPSNGRYNGVQLLFSIPHAKIKPDIIDGSRAGFHKNPNVELGDASAYEHNNGLPSIDEHTTASVNPIPVVSPMVVDKSINQLLPKNFIANTNGFINVNDQIIATENARARRAARTPFAASDRIHATLQKAVKDGNVLEKIKAFEMQAAAAQAELTTKLGSNAINSRMQSIASPIPPAAYRALSPPIIRTMHHPISPMPLSQHDLPAVLPLTQQQVPPQFMRSHRSRHVYPAQQRYDGNVAPMAVRESRKGAHVLEPALGDIILKRRTPSQKTANDEDYSMTMMSSMAFTTSQGHNHRQHHHRTSVSRSRHRKESVHDKRTSNGHESNHKKSQPKQKDTTRSSSAKSNTRHRWLKSNKETTTKEAVNEKVQQDTSTNKSSKANKSKKKNDEKKVESQKKVKSPIPKGKTPSSDNNRVYGVPTTNVHENIKSEPTSPQPPSRIEEENEADREEKIIEKKTSPIPSPIQEENPTETKQSDTKTERSTNKISFHKKLSNTDVEVFNKAEDDTGLSRPTDNPTQHSEPHDDNEVCKSEGNVFTTDLSLINVNSSQKKSSSNAIRRFASQCSAEKFLSDRRWQWSKESGGLIDKGSRKKKQSTTNVSSKEKLNQDVDDEPIVYEMPLSEQSQILQNKSLRSTTPEKTDEQNHTKQVSKQILHAIMNPALHTQEEPAVNDFFDNGPYTNPEETMTNITSTA